MLGNLSKTLGIGMLVHRLVGEFKLNLRCFHSSAPSNLRTKIDAIANPMETRLTIDHISRVAWTRRMGL